MCLSIPAEIISIDNNKAKVSVGGTIYNAGLDLIENVQVGDFVLLHSGYAIQKLDKKDAEDTLDLLKKILSTQ